MGITPHFWSALEESVNAAIDPDACRGLGVPYTQSGCGAATPTLNTKTCTLTREEDDQDPAHAGFSVVARTTSCGTQTMTRMREEPDQDLGHQPFSAVPRWLATQTKTLTAQREEPDQDPPRHEYSAIPRAAQRT